MRSINNTFIFKVVQLKLIFCHKNKLRIVKHIHTSFIKARCEVWPESYKDVPWLPTPGNRSGPGRRHSRTLSAKCWMIKDVFDILGFSNKGFLLTKLLYSF